MTDWAHAWAAWMSAMTLQATILIAVVALLDALLRRWAWPQVRGALWLLVLLKLLLPPTLASPAAVVRVAAPALPPAPVGLMVAWLLGALLLAAATARRHARLRRAVRADRPCPPPVAAIARRAARRLGLRRVPRIDVSDTAPCALVHGAWRPVLVLPAGFLSLPARDLAHVCLHELSHVRRGDLRVAALFRAAQIAYWFHPLVWLAGRRAHGVRELCCDATVAASLRERTPEYRATLLRVAARVLDRPAPGLAFGGTALLLQRLHWLDRQVWRRPARPAALAVGVVALVTLLPMARALTSELEEARRVVAAARDGGSCLQLRHAVWNLMRIEEEKNR